MADYLLPEGMTLAAASKALAEHLDVRDGKLCETNRTYYDTFDGLLRQAGLAAVCEDRQLALIEPGSDRVRARLAMPKAGAKLFAHDLKPGPLRAALTRLVDVRALLPVTEIHSRERPLDVLDGEQKTVVRLRVAQPALGRRRLRPRVHVSSVRGYDKALRRVSEVLRTELGFQAAEQPLVDEAVTAAGGTPGGTPAKIEVVLVPEERADRAAVMVLLRLFEVIQANVQGAITDVDVEFLHDLRVSVRRTRAVQRELRRVFPPDELARFGAEFRWLQQVTGDVRDLDVYELEFDSIRALMPAAMRPDLEPVLAVLGKRRVSARRRMTRALRSDRTSLLLSEWPAFLGSLESLPEDDRPGAARPIGPLAGERIAKVYRRMVKMGEAIDDASPSSAYHELRKQGKELRYLLELFGKPLYPAEVVGPMIKSLKLLQDVLGRHQDREIQVTALRSLGPEVAAADGAAALMAMGVLVEHLEEDQQAARRSYAQRFQAFASGRQRKRVKDTFE